MFIPGVGNAYFVYTNNSDTPLTSWNDSAGGVTTTYKVFAVGWAGNFFSAASVPTMTEWGVIIFIALLGLAAIYYLRRKGEV